MARGWNGSMVEAMARLSRKLPRYGAATAFFACGVAFLVAGWSAAFAWTLIVVALVCAAQSASTTLAGSPSEQGRGAGADSREQRVAGEQRHLAESRRSLSGPR
jgi:hypothetical protein